MARGRARDAVDEPLAEVGDVLGAVARLELAAVGHAPHPPALPEALQLLHVRPRKQLLDAHSPVVANHIDIIIQS